MIGVVASAERLAEEKLFVKLVVGELRLVHLEVKGATQTVFKRGGGDAELKSDPMKHIAFQGRVQLTTSRALSERTMGTMEARTKLIAWQIGQRAR